MIKKPDFSALFAASPYPYLLVDTDFVIIGANPSYLRSTARTAEDIVGKDIFEAFPANPDDPASTNLDEVRRSIERAIATRAPHTSALLRYAVPRATPDGTVFDERYWSAIHTPVFDAAGAVAYVAQNAIDVTDLYRFDAASARYYLKHDADAVPDIPQIDRPQMHEAMTRILSAERSQLQVLFDQAPGFIAVLTGPEHVYEMANEAYYDLVGHRDLVGKPARTALPELAAQGFDDLLERAYATGRPVLLRERRIALQRRRGAAPEERYVDLLYQPILDAEGRVTGIFAQGNDVTGACLARRALSENVRQLEAARSNGAFQLELADRIRQLDEPDDVAAAACALLGRRLAVARVLYAEVDEAGASLAVRHEWTAAGSASLAGHALALDDFSPAVAAELRAGRTVVNEDVARDGRTAPQAQRYAAVGVGAELVLPFVKAGRLAVVLAVQAARPRAWQAGECALVQETAARTWSAVEAAQARAALRRERDQSQYIFDSMAEGFAVLDSDWRILRMNAEGLRLTQRGADDVIGRDHWDVWPELRGSAEEAIYRRVMASGESAIVELAHTLPDGRQVWMETRAHRSLDGGIAFFFRDVSERRAVQEQLTVADRRKDEFLAMLAHELRNPLAPIGAAAQLLQRARLDEDRVRHTSQVIGRQVQHMTHLIDDLLDVSRVTRGLVTLDKAALDIRIVVAEAVEQVAPLVQARRHALALHLPPDMTMVDGDRKRLVQVVTNILNNAAKYTPEGGHIVLEAALRAGQVVIEIGDDGIGMAPDLVAHAFELFAQAERSPDRSAGGLGLGLALVKSLVELHGGSAACRSPGPGMGSTFTVALPHLATEPGAGAVPDVEAPAGTVSALRILVVDDNVDAASMLGMLLQVSGYEVAVEYGARQALARAAADVPDVCLLDIGLPEMDGTELARALRRLPALKDAVLIAVTGYGQESDRRRILDAGFDHHLVKPIDMQALFAILAA